MIVEVQMLYTLRSYEKQGLYHVLSLAKIHTVIPWHFELHVGKVNCCVSKSRELLSVERHNFREL